MKLKSSIIALCCLTSLTATTYQDSGVDIDKGQKFVDAIKPIAKETTRLGAVSEIGGFGGLFDLSCTGYKNPLLVSTTDGVGTKLKLTIAANKYETIGIDLVAMSVNDLLAQGAEPLFFLDYYATGKINYENGLSLIKGIANGCKKGRCALIGGETAEMPGVYKEQDYDLAGFAVGVVEKGQLLPKLHEMAPGDIVIGLASSGLHSNGFSLVRKIIADNHVALNEAPPFETTHQTLAEALLEPTKIYVDAVLPLCKQNKVKAIAHITGGGLIENIPRILPSHLMVELDRDKWSVPPIFQWIKELGDVEDHEMARTYNLGIGMILIIKESDIDAVIHHLIAHDQHATVIGVVSPRGDHQPAIVLHSKISASMENFLPTHGDVVSYGKCERFYLG